MIVDSSAIVALLNREPEAREFADVLEAVDNVKISAVSLVEVAVAAGRDRSDIVTELILDIGLDVISFDASHAVVAREAFVKYGRGSGSKAKLNFGDCMTYALAKATGEPLLFKGDDFTHTDLESARGQSRK